LYPSSDDLAFLYAKNQALLRPYFRLYQPAFEGLWQLLNKRLLYGSAVELGFDVPRSWFPADDAAVQAMADGLTYPVLIKPQTQVFLNSRAKGVLVTEASELLPKYREWVEQQSYQEPLLQHDATAARPMIQAYYAEAAEKIYSLSGFIDETHTQSTFRAAVKVLQRPRRLGIGLCFEEAPVDEALASKLVALCKRVGYHGVFESEFIQVDGKYLLIDFNPRFYSQMAFEIARGLPLPALVYEAASQERESLRTLIEHANRWRSEGPFIYCHRLVFEVLLLGQRLSGRLDASEVMRWRNWYRLGQRRAVDAVMDPSDRLPGWVDWAQHLFSYLRHPRAFLRRMVLDK
jgi:predicted ATP-grasp superfamily ATP-dependent carboligase